VEFVHYRGFIVTQFVWVSVQNVFLLSHCLIAISFMYFVLCYVLINCFKFFNYSFFMFDALVCTFYFLFSLFCVFILSCLSPCIKVFILYFLYNFTVHFHWVSAQLQLINIISYCISYHIIISYHISCHIISYHIISCQSYRIISYHHIISYHIMSYHIVSYHINVFVLSLLNHRIFPSKTITGWSV